MLLGTDHIKQAISDPNFFTSVPEFLTIKRKLEAMHLDVGTGCLPCQKRRAATSVTSDFVTILNGLSDDGLQRVKKYLGVNRLLVRTVNKASRKTETREI